MSGNALPENNRRLERFRSVIHDITGIQMPPNKDVMIESRLRRRLIDLNLPSIDAYLKFLFDGNALEEEIPLLVDLLTTNKTDFFREEAHFLILRNHLVPEALARTRPGGRARFRLWSAAASTGAEAWSAAMVLAQIASEDPRLDWAILGTDISGRVLQIARTAIYSASELGPVPADLRDAYVMTGREGTVVRGRIVPELRARVHFVAMNLMEMPYPIETELDVIFLRNVLIYFKPEVQNRVITAISRHLRSDGHLIVGHSESMTVRVPDLHQVAPGVFRREGGH